MAFTKVSLALAVACLISSCQSGPHIKPHRRNRGSFANWENPQLVPLIVVAKIKDFAPIRAEVFEGSSVSLWWADLVLENVLRGDLKGGALQRIYYFLYYQGGPPVVGDWGKDERYLLFLTRDSGIVRPVCDGDSTCSYRIESGFHPGIKVDSSRSLAESIVDLLLTRGEGCSDKQMIDAVRHTREKLFSEEYTMQKLHQIVQTETVPVRRAACEKLVNLRTPCTAAEYKAIAAAAHGR